VGLRPAVACAAVRRPRTRAVSGAAARHRRLHPLVARPRAAAHAALRGGDHGPARPRLHRHAAGRRGFTAAFAARDGARGAWFVADTRHQPSDAGGSFGRRGRGGAFVPGRSGHAALGAGAQRRTDATRGSGGSPVFAGGQTHGLGAARAAPVRLARQRTRRAAAPAAEHRLHAGRPNTRRVRWA